MNRKILAGLIFAASGLLLPFETANAETAKGVGKAQVTKGNGSFRALAEAEARKDAVRALLTKVIGIEGLRAVNESVISELANQLPSANIINIKGDFVKLPGEKLETYQLEIEVEVDGQWLSKLIDDYGIKIPSQQNAQIMLVLDSFVGVASDSSKPEREILEFNSQKGSVFSDTSSENYSEKERFAESQSNRSASSGRVSVAAGVSGRGGSAAGSGRASGSSANSNRSASAYSQNVNAASQNNVQAVEYDNVYLRTEVRYQGGTGKSGPAEAAANAFGGALRSFGINTNPPTSALRRFNVERFKQLQEGPWNEFLSFAATNGNNYILGGELRLINAGKDPSSQQYLCSGTITVAGFSSVSATNEGIANGYKQTSASGQDEQECQNRLSETLAKLLATEVGPQIQRNWRSRIRAEREATSIQNRIAQEGGEYFLTIRSPLIDFQTKKLVVEVLNSLPSIRKPYVQVSQTQKELVFRVTYTSPDGQDLGMTFLSGLVDRNASLGNSPLPVFSGQSVTVCLLACN
jgi:hypothetical protein